MLILVKNRKKLLNLGSINSHILKGLKITFCKIPLKYIEINFIIK